LALLGTLQWAMGKGIRKEWWGWARGANQDSCLLPEWEWLNCANHSAQGSQGPRYSIAKVYSQGFVIPGQVQDSGFVVVVAYSGKKAIHPIRKLYHSDKGRRADQSLWGV
jgi:hypothetical protein